MEVVEQSRYSRQQHHPWEVVQVPHWIIWNLQQGALPLAGTLEAAYDNHISVS